MSRRRNRALAEEAVRVGAKFVIDEWGKCGWFTPDGKPFRIAVDRRGKTLADPERIPPREPTKRTPQ